MVLSLSKNHRSGQDIYMSQCRNLLHIPYLPITPGGENFSLGLRHAQAEHVRLVCGEALQLRPSQPVPHLPKTKKQEQHQITKSPNDHEGNTRVSDFVHEMTGVMESCHAQNRPSKTKKKQPQR